MRILLATDGSEYSETAARYLQRLGFGPKDHIEVMHAFRDYLVPDELEAARDFKKAGLGAAQALVEEYRKHLLPCECEVTTRVREGDPWREIMEGAAQFRADLVVMGHKGLAGIGGFLLGSVTRKVVRHSEFPVLVVRELQPLERPMRVLYCTDGSFAARCARDMLADLPFGPRTEVEVLSVVDMEMSSLPERYYPDEEVSLMMAELREHNKKLAEDAVAQDAGRLRERFGKVDAHVVFGLPAQEILKAAEQLKADLIAVGSKGIHGIKGALIGSVSAAVMKHADCGVLIAQKTSW